MDESTLTLSALSPRRLFAAAVATTVMVASLLAPAATAGARGAAGASAPTALTSVPGTTELRGVACSASKPIVCDAVGINDPGTSAVVVPIHGHVVGTAVSIPALELAQAIACPTAATCEVLGLTQQGAAAIVPIAPGSGAPGTAVPIPSLAFGAAITCPTIDVCDIVGWTPGNQGAIVPFAVATGTPGTQHVVPGTTRLAGIACPTSSTCEAAGATGSFGSGTGAVVRLDGASGIPQPIRTVPNTTDLGYVACTKATSCIAVGDYESDTLQGVVVPVKLPSGAPGAAEPVGGGYFLSYGVACPNTSTCEAVGTNDSSQGAVVPITQGIPTEEPPTAVSGFSFIQAIACPTKLICERVGSAAGGGGLISEQGPVRDSSPNVPDGQPCPGSGGGSGDQSAATAYLGDPNGTGATQPFGGVYAAISSAPVCRDAAGSVPSSSWVMLQVPPAIESNPLYFAQAGIYYGLSGADYPFVEFNYRGWQNQGYGDDGTISVGMSVEFLHLYPQDVSSGIFTVDVVGPTTDRTNCQWVIDKGRLDTYKPFQGDVPDKGLIHHKKLELEADINLGTGPQCLWIFYMPLKLPNNDLLADKLTWANLAGEASVSSSSPRIPGSYYAPLAFTDAHIYYNGGWQNFVSNYSGNNGNPPQSSAANLYYPNPQPSLPQTCHLASGSSPGPAGGAGWTFYTWTRNYPGACNPWAN
jgi:hypothetical protein